MEKFIIGVLCGGIVGALAVSNNAKMRMLVKKGEDELKEKINGIVDEKLSTMLEKVGKSQENGQDGADGQTGAQEKVSQKSKKKADKKQTGKGAVSANESATA